MSGMTLEQHFSPIHQASPCPASLPETDSIVLGGAHTVRLLQAPPPGSHVQMGWGPQCPLTVRMSSVCLTGHPLAVMEGTIPAGETLVTKASEFWGKKMCEFQN